MHCITMEIVITQLNYSAKHFETNTKVGQHSQNSNILMNTRPNNKKTLTSEITWNVANYFEYMGMSLSHPYGQCFFTIT